MEFRSILIANPAQLSTKHEQLVIRQGEEISLPMEDISSLMIESRSVTITSAAIQKLSDYGVTIYFCDEKHLPSAVNDSVALHENRLRDQIPPRGSIRMLVITEKQYDNIRILLGDRTIFDEPQKNDSLMVF